jgi:hypothetical protein
MSPTLPPPTTLLPMALNAQVAHHQVGNASAR